MKETSSKRVSQNAIELGIGLGRIPPQAVEFEEAILGAMLSYPKTIDNVKSKLSPLYFYKESNMLIYKAIESLSEKNEPFDIISVCSELRKTGDLDLCGGPYYVTELTNKIISVADNQIDFYCRLIIEKYLSRKLIEISLQASSLAYEDTSDVFELLEKSVSQIESLIQNGNAEQTRDFKQQVKDAVVSLAAIKSHNGISGFDTGFEGLNRILKGLQKGELIILGARPGMGKTTLAIQIALNLGKRNVPVLIFSLEMSEQQMINKMISSETEIPMDVLRGGTIDESQWRHIANVEAALWGMPFELHDTAAEKVKTIRSKVRAFKKKHDEFVVILDYLQLTDGNQDGKRINREQEIGVISRSFKGIAKEFNVPFLSIASLSRGTEQRGGEKRPMLSDLRDSGSIESDADVVAFLYRPEYYGIIQDADGNDLRGVCECIIAKNRNGATDSIFLTFNGAISKFTDMKPKYF